MEMKKIIKLFLITVTSVMCVACSYVNAEKICIEPQASQMKSICELAVMDCYYHNVAKYKEESAEGILWWKKDKNFWIEYSGIVRLGINVSLVNIDVNDSQVTITIPEAEVLGCKVDSSSLSKDAYIVSKDSAHIKAEDETYAFGEAQSKLEETASNNTILLAEAQQRAQNLLEDYVTNIGNAVGKEYYIKWVYVDKNGKPSGISTIESSN